MTADAAGRCPDCGGMTDAGEERCRECALERVDQLMLRAMDYVSGALRLTRAEAYRLYAERHMPEYACSLARALNQGTRRR